MTLSSNLRQMAASGPPFLCALACYGVRAQSFYLVVKPKSYLAIPRRRRLQRRFAGIGAVVLRATNADQCSRFACRAADQAWWSWRGCGFGAAAMELCDSGGLHQALLSCERRETTLPCCASVLHAASPPRVKLRDKKSCNCWLPKRASAWRSDTHPLNKR